MILNGDCLLLLPTLEPDSIDSCVTDPPYGLSFMGKDWDHGVPGVAFWVEVLRVLKPGAHLVAFGGTRTYHRLTCAIEDAGFQIRDCLGWIYGSGFPKSHNIGNGFGTALKPAWEPIILARKPLQGTVAANVEKHGTGAMNIDGCRISTDGEDMGDPSRFVKSDQNLNEGWQRPHKADTDAMTEKAAARFERAASLGRWPANICHDGSEEVLAVFPDSESPATVTRGGSRQQAFGMGRQDAVPCHGDSGSAARFFYCAKASKKDRGD